MTTPRFSAIAAVFVVVSLSAPVRALQAQGGATSSPAASPGMPVVKLDVVTRTFDKPLPYDQPFFLQIPLPNQESKPTPPSNPAAPHTDNATAATPAAPKIGQLSYGYLSDDDTNAVKQPIEPHAAPLKDPTHGSSTTFLIKALKANRRVIFSVQIVDSAPAPAPKPDSVTVAKHLAPKPLGPFMDQAGTQAVLAIGRTATTFKDYFRTDVGLSFAPHLLTGLAPRPTYVGGGSNVHVYFVPINDAARVENFQGWDNVWKRVSVFGGLNIFDLKSSVPIEHMFSAGTPVAGGALRPWFCDDLQMVNSLFINVGIMWFNEKDNNPLVSQEHGKRTRFIGVGGTIDWKDVLGPLAVLLGSKS